MIYPSLDPRTIGFIAGAFLILVHGAGLFCRESAGAGLRLLPRSKAAGIILATLAGIWAFLLIANMDLGEFTSYRHPLMFVVAGAYFLTLQFVDEFLAVRAIGMLLLLLAEPLLEAAFLRHGAAPKLLVTLAYVWVIAGTFWVGMPYLMRDEIDWVLKAKSRWLIGCLAGMVYGVALVVCSAMLQA